MFSMLSKFQPTENITTTTTTTNNNNNYVDEEQEVPVTYNLVTSHHHIKPTDPTQTLDKEVVLRRIRQRKRVNKWKAMVQALVSSAFSAKPEKAVSVHGKKWIDDAFAAP